MQRSKALYVLTPFVCSGQHPSPAPMGLDLPSISSGSQLDLAREDADAVQRLRQNYPPHILASLFEKDYITTRGSELLILSIAANI